MSDGLLYEVQTCFGWGQWENCWHDENGEPQMFNTSEEAQLVLNDFLEAVVEAGLQGYDAGDYRIVGVKHG